MRLPDTNVLLYAANADAPQHVGASQDALGVGGACGRRHGVGGLARIRADCHPAGYLRQAAVANRCNAGREASPRIGDVAAS